MYHFHFDNGMPMVVGGKVSSIWRDAQRSAGIKVNSFTIWENINFAIGNGNKALFQHDSWVLDRPLKDEFPWLFVLSSICNACAADMGSWNGGNWIWTLEWRRALLQWETTLLDSLVVFENQQ